MSRNWSSGSTSRWRRIRLLVLERDRYTCQIQREGVCIGQADQVDHVLGRSVTGDDPRYLRAACGPCNRAAGDPTRRPDPPHVRTVTRW